jgi:hypothetical protein
VHIPTPFTPERPSLYFTKEHFDVAMSEHPEASKLPAAGDKPAIFPAASEYASLGFGPGAPRNIDDYLYSDAPQFSLHVVTFEDGTLVSINFNHVTTDAGGLRAVLDAWQLHLAGRPEAKAEFMSIRDGMAGLYEGPPPQPNVIADMKLSGWRMAVWGLRFVWDNWWTSHERRTLCIPKTIMDKLLQNARNDLARVTPNGQEVPFVTEGDVLLALSLRLAAHDLGTSSTRSITQMMAVDPRGRVKSAFKEGGAYVQNSPAAVFASCSAPDAREKSLGELALHIRKAIVAQTTEAQLLTMAAEGYDVVKKTGNILVFSGTDGLFTVSSSWSRAKLLESVDFSPAIVKPSAKVQSEGSTWKPGHPVFYHSRDVEKSSAFSTKLTIIMGRDHGGNMWVAGDQSLPAWSRLIDILDSQ